jgi:hypothetical protein
VRRFLHSRRQRQPATQSSSCCQLAPTSQALSCVHPLDTLASLKQDASVWYVAEAVALLQPLQSAFPSRYALERREAHFIHSNFFLLSMLESSSPISRESVILLYQLLRMCEADEAACMGHLVALSHLHCQPSVSTCTCLAYPIGRN